MKTITLALLAAGLAGASIAHAQLAVSANDNKVVLDNGVSSDSKTLLVQNMVEKDIQVFRIEGDELRETLHRIKLKGGGAAIRTAEK